MTIEAIFERIATALESIAQQGNSILSGESAGGLTSATTARPEKSSHVEDLGPDFFPSEEGTNLAWNPLEDTKVMSRYGADKLEVLRAAVKAMGTPGTEKLSGGELHKLVLENAKADAAEKVDPPSKADTTITDVKTALAEYAARRTKAGSPDALANARAIMAHFGGGVAKADAIEEQYWQAVIDAAKSDWSPEVQIAYTLEDLKAAVKGYADRRKNAGSSDPRGDALALMAQFGNGKAKTDDIDQADYAAVIVAAGSDWMPESEDL